MLLSEKFKVTPSSPGNERVPTQGHRDTPGLGQEAEAGVTDNFRQQPFGAFQGKGKETGGAALDELVQIALIPFAWGWPWKE